MLGCAGSHNETPGRNAKRLAEIICATVVAGELSLLAAQCSNDLVQSHMKLNRSTIFNPRQDSYLENKFGSRLIVITDSKAVRHAGKSVKDSCMTNIL
jgi:hydroxymethylglutaryl-CoA reductase